MFDDTFPGIKANIQERKVQRIRQELEAETNCLDKNWERMESFLRDQEANGNFVFYGNPSDLEGGWLNESAEREYDYFRFNTLLKECGLAPLQAFET